MIFLFFDKNLDVQKFVGSATWVVVVVLNTQVYQLVAVVAEELKPSGNLLQLFSTLDVVQSNWIFRGLFSIY